MRALIGRLILAAALLTGAPLPLGAVTGDQLAVLSNIVNPKPEFSCYFLFGTSCGATLSVTRSGTGSIATNLLPNAASGAGFNTFAANVLRLSTNRGILVEGSPATNFLLNSATPATQTTGTLPVGPIALWCNGAGSAALTAGTATITGLGTCTQGNEVDATVTVAGTAVVTVTGTLSMFQLENNTQGSSYVITTTATATRGAETVTLNGLNLNGAALSIVVEFQPTVVVAATNYGLIGNGGPVPSIFYNSTGSTITFPGIANGVSATAAIARFGTYRLAYGVQSGNMNAATNGVLTLPGNNQGAVVSWNPSNGIQLGWSPSPGTQGMQWIRGISVYSSRISNSLLVKKSIPALGNPF